jgi:hypothetical protein
MAATSAAVVTVSASAARERACCNDSDRIMRRVRAMRAGETLISSTPRPTSNGSISGSPAASPQTSTGIPAVRAAATTRAISRITAG